MVDEKVFDRQIECRYNRYTKETEVAMAQAGKGECGMENAVEVKNLTKDYGAFKLDDVSFDVGFGGIVGLIGANGAAVLIMSEPPCQQNFRD